MITMSEFVDLKMQQHIAHEIYRRQIMQRIPDPFPPILPIPIPHHIVLPPRVGLPGVDISLQNEDLWKQFHKIGTEMIITKSGRRMFPSMRLSISGLDDDSNYCILLEMVPVSDCRYKFSGSHWVPAGGAEPQSPQRMYLHNDSPASGAHWQAQPILFNKVKLTNNTLDNNGHIVLASMHKYQPRIHVIRTSDPTQIPWSPQEAFVFPETEFVAVTAYQNDRITKLKIDNNPFAKGFRESGQSRCKRKISTSPEIELEEISALKSIPTTRCNVFDKHQTGDFNKTRSNKRQRSNGSTCSVSSLDDAVLLASISSNDSSGKNSPNFDQMGSDNQTFILPKLETSKGISTQGMHSFKNPPFLDLTCSYFGRTQQMYRNDIDSYTKEDCAPLTESVPSLQCLSNNIGVNASPQVLNSQENEIMKITRSKNFSISAILGGKI